VKETPPRILLAEDSVTFRRLVEELVEAESCLELAGAVTGGL